jgi:hypothetical protein
VIFHSYVAMSVYQRAICLEIEDDYKEVCTSGPQ